MNLRHLLPACALLLSGCATIVGTETQPVKIDSVPQGARYTPQTVDLAKSNGTYFGKKHYQVMLESPGYVPLTLPIEASANLWYVLGNIPLLGFPGWLVVDPFYGGMYDLKPAHPQPHLNVVGARGG